jgi:hypothetical protein
VTCGRCKWFLPIVWGGVEGEFGNCRATPRNDIVRVDEPRCGRYFQGMSEEDTEELRRLESEDAEGTEAIRRALGGAA